MRDLSGNKCYRIISITTEKLNHLLVNLLIMKKLYTLLAPLFIGAITCFSQVWINEFHYDNDGADVGEFVEIFVPASYSGPLSQLRLDLYNGNNGASYGNETVDPDFTQGATINGVGTFYSIEISGIQNGAPDGFSLSDGNGLIQFISYEGTFTAVGGPADGALSEDVGVEQVGTTPVGASIALTGTGSLYSDFAWVNDDTATPGAINNGQVIEAGVAPTGPQPPAGLSASNVAFPSNKDTLEVSFTPSGSDDVLLVYSTEDVFGTPVDSTAYAAEDILPGGGIVAGIFPSSPATVDALIPGTTYFFKAFSVDGSNEYSAATSSVSASTDTFALQFGAFSTWTAIDVLGEDTWNISPNSSDISGFDEFDGGTNPEEDWLISPEINLDNFEGETFEFDYSSQFVDPAAVGLELFYTTAYTGDPTTTSWIPFTDINADFDTNKSIDNSPTDTFTASADLSSISGTTVRLGFKYTTGGVEVDARTWNLSDPLISGNGVSEETITLSSDPAAVDEGQSQTVTLSVPTAVGSNTDFFLSSNGDGSELNFPSIVTILNGANSVDFSVNGLTDDVTDGDITVDLIANRSGYTVGSLPVIVNDIDELSPANEIAITQYYEGAGNDRYLELTNVSGSPVDMTGYTLVRWGNELAEDYKTATAVPADDNYSPLDLTPLGTLAAGQTVVLANSEAVAPIATADAALTQSFDEGGALSFNGNDSLVIYNTSTPSPANIIDAIGFTNTGFEGSNTSFVRTSLFLGYDLATGSNVTSPGFSTVWSEITTATVDAALFGEDAFLGSTDLVTAPPSVRFLESSQIVDEAEGTVTLTVVITSPDGNAVDVDVVFNPTNSDADASDIGNFTTQTVSFGSGASDGDTQTVIVNLTDDAIEEPTESAVFDLANLTTSGAISLANPSSTTVSIQDDDTVIPALLISEVADPSDEFSGRYVEIFNASASTVDLTAGSWTLTRVVQTGTIGNIPLTGSIPAGGTYIVANSDTGFALYGGNPADQTSFSISGNGDDSYSLYFGGDNATGTLVDIYGVVGVDGSGEPWEYEDSRAYRNADVVAPSDVWNAAEWTIEPATIADMTPGIHPESSVPSPTAVSAAAISESEIEIAFTPAGSGDVLVVFNQTGSFTTPSGTPPAAGQPFAGGTVLSLGTASPTLHSGLASETEYFYSLYTFDGTDYSNVVLTSATTPIAGLVNIEDFEDPAGDADDWFNATVTGTDVWEIITNAGNRGARIDASLNAGADRQYLVSPELNLSSATDVTIAFDFVGGYDDGDPDSIELVYSTDYSGNGDPEASALWTEIPFDFSSNLQAGDPTSVVNSNPVALPGILEGQSTVYLAFRYTGDGTLTGSEQWFVDNILVQSSGSTPPTAPLDDYLTQRSLSLSDLETDTNGNGFTVIEEYFAGFGDGAGGDTIVYGSDPAGPALTLTSDLQADPDGVSVQLLATSDLTTAFASVAFTVSSVANGDGTFTRSYTETNPPAEADTRFYQLSITIEVE